MNDNVDVNRRNSICCVSAGISNRRRRFNDIIHLIAISAAISILINFVALSLRSSYLLCDTNLFSERLKSEFLKCSSSSKAIRTSFPNKVISYFEDPIITEFPLKSTTGEKDLIVRFDNNEKSSLYDVEALAAMRAARRFRTSGNLKKAQVVMVHAFSLSPKHPDVLTEYGIVLETAANDVVAAEGFYKRALVQDPQHSEALIQRARALPLVEEIDNRMMQEIYRKKDIFLNIPRTDAGLKRAMRESYFQHIYHTVALEGNTMTLIQTRSILETKLAVAGKSIVEHNEILGIDAALRYLNQSLTNIGELTLDHILMIHKHVLGFVDPISAGVIRNTQVYVGGFMPSAPEAIPSELEEFISWINDEETMTIDPVELAALAHYKLVFIHPFVDGNGRTSRLLMNYILMQAGFPPVIINVTERLRYYLALQQANEGDLRPFIRFIAEETDRTLEKYIVSATMMCDACTSTLNNQADSLNGETHENQWNKASETPTIISVP